jgi:DNA polymerase I
MILTLDFETDGIKARPVYPPTPRGLAIYVDGGEPAYYAWGHPTDNNETEEFAKGVCASLMAQATKIIFHNAPFDGSILEEKWGLKVPWDRVEDTMVMAFIDNPHGELSLKPLAEQHLGLPPEERDAVKDWLISHGVCRDTKGWGAHICKAPGGLVGEYAKGDVQRTYELYQYYLKKWENKPHLFVAYRREMDLMPHILRMDQHGVQIDVENLSIDLNAAYAEMDWLDTEISRILGKEVDVDSNDELADAIEAAGLSKGFASTTTGKRSVAKDSLLEAVSDPLLLGHLLVRNSLATCIRTFMHPWLVQAKQTGGRLFIKFNQVRNYSEVGARTGRLSSSPNLQNVPDAWEKLQSQLDKIGYQLHAPMPRVRKYLIADEGKILIGRDYSGQELRLLAHFAGGHLLETLQKNPEADVHMIAANVAGITRKVAKTLGFAVLYGAGIGKIAESLYISIDDATRIKKQYLEALPEIKALQSEVQYRGRSNQPITTLGGRDYYCETAKVMGGRLRTFEYKLINYLIQSSAADQSKQAMIDYATRTKHGRLYLMVHDEILIECLTEHQDEEAALLAECMNNSFQSMLDYQIISTEARGQSYGDLG